jgi:hypothetical protein
VLRRTLFQRDDLHRRLGDHVVAEPDLHRIGPQRLDPVLHLDLVTVDRDADLLVQRVRNLGVGHGSEQPAVAAGFRHHADRRLLELRCDVVGIGDFFGLFAFLGVLLLFELFHRPGRRDDGQALREQIVVRVPVLDVDERSARAERLDVAGEDDLHSEPPTERRTGAERSRARV